MIKYLFIFSLSLLSNLFAQQKSIPTEFALEGNVYKNLDDTNESLAQFKEGDRCAVIDYIGKYTYKVKYKSWVGFVKDQFLVINEDVMDLFFDFEEKARLRAIEEKRIKQEKIKEASNNNTELIEKRKADSIAIAIQAKKALQLEAKRKDSIAKIEEAKRIQQIEIAKAQALAKAKEEQRILLEEKRKADSIAIIIQAKKTLELEAKRKDSIAKIEEAKRFQQIEIAKAQALAKAKEEQRILLEEKRKADSIAIAIQVKKTLQLEAKKKDSIAKIEEAKRIQQVEIAKAQALAKAKEEQRILLEEKRKVDSIAIAIQAQKTLQLEAKKKDPIAKIEEAKRIQANIAVENIPKVKTKEEEQKEKAALEKIKFRNTCHYQMNEFDNIYNQRIIRTEPYSINKKLTVELYRQGQSINIFFNLLEDLGCASYLPSNRSYVKVTLENNQKITFYHSWNIDCADFSFKGKMSNSQMINLKKSPIKSIFFKGTKHSSEVANIEYKEFFIDKLKCLD